MSTVKIPRGDYYSVEDAASELQLTVGRIRQMIRWGHMRAIKITDRAWIIPATEVEKAKRERENRRR